MATALQCPGCGHRHRLEDVAHLETFPCAECSRALRVPAAHRRAAAPGPMSPGSMSPGSMSPGSINPGTAIPGGRANGGVVGAAEVLAARAGQARPRTGVIGAAELLAERQAEAQYLAASAPASAPFAAVPASAPAPFAGVPASPEAAPGLASSSTSAGEATFAYPLAVGTADTPRIESLGVGRSTFPSPSAPVASDIAEIGASAGFAAARPLLGRATRALIWVFALLVGGALTLVPARQAGLLTIDRALDVLAVPGWRRWKTPMMMVPVWAFISAALAHVLIEFLTQSKARRQLKSLGIDTSGSSTA